jgi:hypothetical protein
MLIACIAERSGRRLTAPAELPVPRDREMLGLLLSAFARLGPRPLTESTRNAHFIIERRTPALAEMELGEAACELAERVDAIASPEHLWIVRVV